MGLLLFSFFLFTLQFNFKLKKPNVYWTWGRRIVGADGSIEHLVTSLNAQFGSYVKLTLSALILPENLVNFCSCCNYLVVNVVVTVQFYVIAPAHHFFLSSLFICNAIFVRPSFKNVIQSKVVFFKLFLAIHLSFSLSLSLSLSTDNDLVKIFAIFSSPKASNKCYLNFNESWEEWNQKCLKWTLPTWQLGHCNF